MSDSELWEVSAIIGRRREAVSGKIEYLVRWKGYDDSQATWETESNCSDCWHLIDEFLGESGQTQK